MIFVPTEKGKTMAEKEKCLSAMKTAREEVLVSSNGIRFYPVIENALDYAISFLQEHEEVRHGRWEECDWVEYDGHGECIHYPHEGYVCTNCRNAFKKEFVNNPRVIYCPHCGAKMDGG